MAPRVVRGKAAPLVVVVLALAAAVAVCEGEPEALPSDDECSAGADCALNHLQLRVRERRSQEEPSAIPLSAVRLDAGIRLAVSVSPVAPDGTVLPAQLLQLDSGSSTMAFCKNPSSDTVAKEAITVNQTKIVACNLYEPEGDHPVHFWGFFYQGSLQIGQSPSPFVVKSAFYSVMQVQEGMPCNEHFQGIFGIAYGLLDQGYAYSDDMKDWAKEGLAAGCPEQPIDHDIAPPIVQVLQGATGPKLFGIRWSGDLGDKAGELYLHGAATANERYTSGEVVGKAALGRAGWYTVGIETITLSNGAAVSVKGAGGPWKDIDCSEEGGDVCMLDTECPVIIVPQDVMAAIFDLSNSSSPMGTISFTLAEASGGAPVELTFDLHTLLAKDWIAGGDGTDIVLGLPTWAFYYTVVDMESNAATFVADAKQRELLRPA